MGELVGWRGRGKRMRDDDMACVHDCDGVSQEIPTHYLLIVMQE